MERKRWLSIIVLLSVLSLAACSQAEEPDSANTGTTDEELAAESVDVPTTWEEVNGFVIDLKEKDGSNMILIAGGITQQEASESTSREILSGDSVENAIWLTNEEIDFPDIQKGDKVRAWWDEGQPHVEPGILTVPAERLEYAEEKQT